MEVEGSSPACPKARPNSDPGNVNPDFSSNDFSSNITMPIKSEGTVRKAAAPDLQVGLICADRDGNRIRIDRVDVRTGGGGTVSYHFLNDELRVQEGVQQRSIQQFLAEGWYIASPGKSL